MESKKLIWLGLFVGSTAGAYVPNLWGGGGMLSYSSLICATIGGLLGIWTGFKLGND